VTRLGTRALARLSSLGIRERLVLLVLAMLVPWIALFATTYANYARDRDRDSRARLNDLATQIGARVDAQVGTIEGILLAVAQTASSDTADIRANDAMLHRLKAELPLDVNNLGLWDVRGRNLGWSNADTAMARQMEVVAHRFFRDALASDTLTVGRPIESHGTKAWSLTMARRIRHGGALVGVVSVTSRLDSLARFLAVGGGSDDGIIITLVDDGGSVLARSGGPAIDIARQVMDPATVRGLRAAPVRSVPAATLDTRLGQQIAYHRVKRAPWVLFVRVAPDAKALVGEPEWRVLVLFGALGLGGALFLAGLVASRIADPLRKLTADAARLGAGDLSVRTNVKAPGEVGTLAATFNQMAATLQARTHALAASEERHRLAARATNDVIWDWDIRTSTVEWSEGAGSAFRTPSSGIGKAIEWWSEH